jgi:hypothetical protein
LARNIPQLNETSGGGFLLSSFPARYGHRRIMQAGAKIGLTQAEALPETEDCRGPFGEAYFFAHICHLMCQVFQWGLYTHMFYGGFLNRFIFFACAKGKLVGYAHAMVTHFKFYCFNA